MRTNGYTPEGVDTDWQLAILYAGPLLSGDSRFPAAHECRRSGLLFNTKFMRIALDNHYQPRVNCGWQKKRGPAGLTSPDRSTSHPMQGMHPMHGSSAACRYRRLLYADSYCVPVVLRAEIPRAFSSASVAGACPMKQ